MAYSGILYRGEQERAGGKGITSRAMISSIGPHLRPNGASGVVPECSSRICISALIGGGHHIGRVPKLPKVGYDTEWSLTLILILPREERRGEV